MAGKALLAVGSCLAAMIAAEASAQTTTTEQPAASAEADSGAIGEIVVTARRRAENLQDVPISMTAYTAETIQARGVSDLKGMTNFTPNLEINSGRADGGGTTAQIYIRGVGQNDFLIPNDPGVGLYVDDVYVARSTGAVAGLSDIQSVEVLRGPQGTLYGKNTIGGAVRITSAPPSFDAISGRMSVTYGAYDRLDFQGSANIPLASNFAIRLSGSSRNTDDLQKRYLDPTGAGQGNINQDAARLIARWKPSDRLDITVSGDYTRTRQHMAYGGNIQYIPGASPLIDVLNAEIFPGVASSLGLPAGTVFDGRWSTAPKTSGATGPNSDDYDVWGVSGIIVYDLTPDIALKSITAYRKVTGFWTRDSDHSPASIVQTNSDWTQDQFSQEVQLLGDMFDGRFNWVLGGYYSDEKGNHKDLVNIVDAVFLSGAVLDGKSLAFFGQGTYEIVKDLNLTAGIRWTEDEKSFGNANQFVVDAGFLRGAPFNPDGSGLQDGDPLMGPLGQTSTIKDTAWTPMVSLAYRFSPELLTYASYSEGFKGGGFTQRVFPPFAFIPSFKPETSTTYELGFKSDLLGRKLRVNGAVFMNDYDNLQITVNDPTLGFAPIIQNAAKARIKGFELEMQARPVGGLQLDAGIGYLDAKYRSVDIRALTAGVTTATKLQNAPKWTLSAGVSYMIEVDGVGNFQPRIDWSYRSRVYNDAVNTPLLIQDGYHLVNASIAYSDADKRWGVTLGVKNLTKEVYLGSGYADSFGGVVEGVYGRPREWFLSARFAF